MSMMTDNPQFQPYLAQLTSFPEYPTEISDIFDTELYNSSFAMSNSGSGSHSESRGSSPQSLLTPPNDPLPNFPEIHDGESGMSSLFQLFDDDMKGLEMPSSSSASFLPPTFAPPTSGFGLSMGIGGYGISTDSLSAMSLSMPSTIPDSAAQGIDPQLVDTPSAVSDNGDDEEKEEETDSPPAPSPVESEKLTLTIAPLKAMRRKGTVHSGGIVKKSASAALSREKENAATAAAISAKKPAPKSKPAPSPVQLTSTPGPFLTESPSVAESEAGDNDDDLPQDWRPSPEVFAKMTSKEKRQLRNKISARNFRVRRKEYISTLEGDIAERDRMLEHFKMKLGSQESENLALRQEIAALKKALLEGRGGAVNLPPPAPLPEQSAAEALAASASAAATASSHPSSPLLTPNTQKDLPTSPRLGNRFWGGVGMGGGITPVHTALVPDISTIVRKGLQENMNPALNARVGLDNQTNMPQKPTLTGFDGFADMNPFTMKTLDAYRMHLWGKMAAQQQAHHATAPVSPPTSNLASGMRPHFIVSPTRTNLPSTLASSGTLSALLSGKTSASSYPTPPTSPQLHTKTITSPKERELQVQREKEQQQAMLAAVASQTIFRKLGGAFWEAFTGGSSSSSSTSSSSNLDADKVKRVLEGKAVLRVVDLEPATPPMTPKPRATAVSSRPSMVSAGQEKEKGCASALTDILEESMRSLTLGKKL
ncbi:hypothetical protein CVT24_006928 [Panaeolus cyanescens]|uniref:BZIP domain-containing protein n=1 Tax=Panaeolus cyanescens TaxID=181874 RepID=A0A409VK98_9AGAR|nr:hypothetical protein CVT24_006928 [Panaeolus cyanescens]